MKLHAKIGFAADSAAVNMWRLAQEFWSRGRGLVPKHLFDSLEFSSELLGVCLAEVRGDMVYVRGSSLHLDWTAEKREAARAGGKKSAQRPRNVKGQLQKSPSKTQAEPKLIQASDSDSDSDSGSSSFPNSSNSATPVGVYVTAYQEKYGIRPEVGPREGKILGTFAKNHPANWAELIRGYLRMPDTWATARSHPVEPLATKANEIGRFIATGKVVTRKVIEHAEEMIDKAQGTNRRPRKSLDEMEAEKIKMLSEAKKEGA